MTSRILTPLLALTLLTPLRVAAQRDTASLDLTLRVRSTLPGQEVAFRGAYILDDHRGLQFVHAVTPLTISGRTASAIAILQKDSGQAQLDVQLLRQEATDTTVLAAAEGLRLIVQYRPSPEWANRRLRETQGH